MTGVALGRRARVFAGALALLVACLLMLTVLQHLVTGFENYRDMTLVLRSHDGGRRLRPAGAGGRPGCCGRC